eukprot:scaffold109203_cov31-Prasinocladus_malaysianus.AAC.1
MCVACVVAVTATNGISVGNYFREGHIRAHGGGHSPDSGPDSVPEETLVHPQHLPVDVVVLHL